jgi:N-acetyl-gamma-glutamyl-phosphate reductase
VNERVSISIVGASGYSGAELLRLMLRHPHIQIEKLFANSSAGKHLHDLYPEFRGRLSKVFEPYSIDAVSTSRVVFLALPSGEAMNLAPDLLANGKIVIDLGGDFRLRNTQDYETYYKHTHHAPDLLQRAVYGLAEWNQEKIKSASLIANPGCYPTSAILPLLPMLKEKLIEPSGITITAMSGVSGAGRKADLSLSFCEVNDSVKAYKVAEHQHIPEINQTLSDFTGEAISVSFVPHLIPITRGIYTTIHATLKPNTSRERVAEAFEKYYANAAFVRVLKNELPELRGVACTNFTDIGFRIAEKTNHLILCSAIDNLTKGAAGQAIQNFNLKFGFNETDGVN